MESKAVLIMNVVLQGVCLFVFLISIAWVMRRRNLQPLKNRTASLIILSLSGNFMLYLFGATSYLLMLLGLTSDRARYYVCDYTILSYTFFHQGFSLP